jgi:hypothetical protein
MKRNAWVGAALTALVLISDGASAQGRPGREATNRVALEERLDKRIAEIVRTELGLTAEQLQEVVAVAATFKGQRQMLARREVAWRRRMRPDNSVGRSDQEAREILLEMTAVREEEARLLRSEMEGLQKTLMPAQVLLFYQVRADLMERFQRLRQDGPRWLGPAGPRGGARGR